jgi:hypothetical protein
MTTKKTGAGPLTIREAARRVDQRRRLTLCRVGNHAADNHTVDLQDANFRIPSYLAADGRMPLYPTCCPAG